MLRTGLGGSTGDTISCGCSKAFLLEMGIASGFLYQGSFKRERELSGFL